MPAFCKPGVTFDGLKEPGLRIKSALDKLADEFKVAVMVTCTTGDHPPTDPHSRGAALDVRTIGWTPENVVLYFNWLKKILGPRYTVLYEVPVSPASPLLKTIAWVNPKATGPHLHTQLRIGLTPDPALDTPIL